MRISTNSDIYETLARFLDDLPAGFPHTESGVELRILKRLFTPEEARLVTHLALIAETPRVIAHRAGLSLEETERLLESLERKQLVYVFREEGKPTTYMAEQFVIGFWEGQVNHLDRALVEDFEEYLPQLFNPEAWGKAPQLRTIPVKQSIPVEHLILPYEQAEEIIRSHSRFGVANCICRQEQRILGHDCGKPVESCLAFDGAAEHYERSGRGRLITREEALALLVQAEQTGLVLQPSNDQNPIVICMCCGCCCGVLRSLKAQPAPADLVSTPYVARLNEDLCAGCGTCIDRCPMDALTMDISAVHDPKRCIGCGLCVTTCPTGALELVRKPAAQQPHVPKDVIWLNIRVARARGKLGAGRAIKIAAKSAVDRIIAPK
jgi:Na+-translocating ferredoxin:NAD+ oxidoreductase subunit B